MSWKTLDDFQKDLMEYSDFADDVEEFKPAPPKTIAEFRARTQRLNNPSIFDSQIENSTIVINGRGRNMKTQIVRPGQSVERSPQDEAEIRRKLREVSGVGYSNEVIERCLRGNMEEAAEDNLVPDFIRLTSTNEVLETSNASSLNSSKSSSPKTIVDLSSDDNSSSSSNHVTKGATRNWNVGAPAFVPKKFSMEEFPPLKKA